MHNYHAIETEAAFRQQEWERAAAADARAARAVPAARKMNWPHLPQFSLAALRSLGSPRLPLARPLAVGGHAGGATQLVDCDA